MNLLIAIHSLQCGGAERVAASLANYWAGKGWQVTVVTLAAPGQEFYQLHPAVHRVGLDMAGESSSFLAAAVSSLRRVLALRRVIKQVRPNVALAMMSNMCILLALATRGTSGVVTVGSERVHPPHAPLSFIWRSLRKWLYGLLHAIVAQSQESANWLRQHTNARHVVVIPNAAQWPLPEQAPHLLPPERPDSQLMLLAVGRLCAQKGFDLLISAFHRLVGEFPNWHLVILGEGPDRDALQAQVCTLDLSKCVSLPGRSGNMGRWYAAADLYVMSSHFEGFPNTLLEAMAYGLPVVSFDCDTGPRDIVRSGLDGLLVPADDPLALTSALRRLMGDESLRRAFATSGADVRERFSIEMIAGKWETLFEEKCHGN